jgi:hypothetical protein
LAFVSSIFKYFLKRPKKHKIRVCLKNLRVCHYYDRYASIATNEECQQLFVAHMQVLQEMPNKPVAIMGLICKYCIFENLLMKFIIENDVGIICLKCVY